MGIPKSENVKSANISSNGPQLEFNVPTTIASSELSMLNILKDTHESLLPEYDDSFFKVYPREDQFVVTRLRKGDLTLKGKVVKFPPFTGPQNSLSNEGLKVRTFTFELLSNLEDFHRTNDRKNENDNFKEVVEIIKYFIRRGVFTEKVGFSDFIHLLNILSDVKEYTSVYERFYQLIDLQKFLLKKEPVKKSPWDKIRTAVHAGLFNKSLDEINTLAQKTGLSPFPALPKKQTFVNLYQTLDAINMLLEDNREAGKWIMHHVKMITFRELCRSIKKSCEQIRDTILTWDNYYLLTVNGKSQEWMANIAYRFLPEQRFKGILSMYHDLSITGFGKALFRHLSSSGSNNFIMFDDAAYSTKQLKGYLDALYNYLERIIKYTFPEKKNIYFIYGFYPEDKYSQDSLAFQKFEKFNVNVKVISNHLIHNMDHLMEEEQLPPELMEKISRLIDKNNPQLITEWKTPDYVSTSRFITRAYIQNETMVKHLFRLYCVNRFTGWGELKKNEKGPVAEVVPPYKSPGEL